MAPVLICVLGSGAVSRIIATTCIQANPCSALNHPDQDMNTPVPELPIHLYDENTSPDGHGGRISYSADRLVAWSEQERGDAIEKWCKQIIIVYGRTVTMKDKEGRII